MRKLKIISLFNNKGGVGKSTLCYHLGYAMNEMAKKVLLIDLDPQCNLTISGMQEEELHNIWKVEDEFIEDYEDACNKSEAIKKVLKSPRSIHFLLKPVEDGLTDIEELPPPVKLADNLDLIPGRLSLHKYENKLAERWNGAYQGDNLSLRTITNIRRIAEKYANNYGYNYVLIDTSPSLGILNKTIISTVDGFFIPAQPDMFSLYGIRNIGNSLELWQKDFNTIYSLISKDKRSKFPNKFVQFMGYNIYNAKKSIKGHNKYELASAHYSYVQKIPQIIDKFIRQSNRAAIEDITSPLGGNSIMHTHNTYPAVAQALKCPIWRIPYEYNKLQNSNPLNLKELNIEYNTGNNGRCREIREKYIYFANKFILRAEVL